MYIHIYTYTYIYLYIYVYIYVYEIHQTHTYPSCAYAYMHACMPTHPHTHMQSMPIHRFIHCSIDRHLVIDRNEGVMWRERPRRALAVSITGSESERSLAPETICS